MNFSIPNIIFVILIAIASSYLTFLTTKGGLTDNRYSSPLKMLTKRGKIVLLILVIIALLLTSQEWNGQLKNSRDAKKAVEEINKKDSLLKKERNQRDSFITQGIKHGVDSSSKKLFEDISKAFKSQGLKIDTLKNTIKIIRDSARVINNYSQNDPFLSIDSNGIKLTERNGSNYHHSVNFTSHDAGSDNYKIKMYVVFQYSDGTRKYVSQTSLLNYRDKMPKDGGISTGFNSYSSKEIANIFIYIKGEYTTLDGRKSYNIDALYMYLSKTNLTKMASRTLKETIIKLIPVEELSP